MTADATRRDVLKGVTLGAGATLLSPFLARLAAHAAGDAKAAAPKRVVFVVQSNGMSPNHLVPVGVKRRPDGKGGPPANDALVEEGLAGKALHPALDPLAPFRDRLALVQGLSGTIANNDHSCNHGALGACPANKGAYSQTVDSALADALPGVFRHVALGYSGAASVTGDAPMTYNHVASAPGKVVPVVCSPDLAFRSLFGSVSAGAGRAAFDRKTHLLDFMADDVRRSRAALAGPEREKFDDYLRAFENLHARQTELVAKADDLKRHAPKLGERPAASFASLTLAAQFDLAAAALLAGVTNVVTLVSGGGAQHFGHYPEVGVPGLHHIGHGATYEGKTNDECFVAIRRIHTGLIAGLAEKLAAAKEGDGTALDNTLIVYLSDSADGHHPGCKEWPVVLLGDLGGRLKTRGRYLQFPAYGAKNHRTMANLYCTLLHAAGRPRDRFGVDDPKLKDLDQSGPVAELLA